MVALTDPILVLVMLVNFVILGSSRMRVTIRAAAAQGAILGVLPLLVHHAPDWRALGLAAGTCALKGFVIPGLLLKAMRDARVRHEVEPYVGFLPSVFLGAAGTGLAMVFADSLPLAPEHVGSLLVPASFATLLTGLLILTSRKKAVSQVVGYLLLENGIFVFGLLLLEAIPLLVEIGVLLDLFAGIFIMGIILSHIRAEFSSLDVDRLAELKD